jgi:hypothetical protein
MSNDVAGRRRFAPEWPTEGNVFQDQWRAAVINHIWADAIKAVTALRAVVTIRSRCEWVDGQDINKFARQFF